MDVSQYFVVPAADRGTVERLFDAERIIGEKNFLIVVSDDRARTRELDVALEFHNDGGVWGFTLLANGSEVARGEFGEEAELEGDLDEAARLLGVDAEELRAVLERGDGTPDPEAFCNLVGFGRYTIAPGQFERAAVASAAVHDDGHDGVPWDAAAADDEELDEASDGVTVQGTMVGSITIDDDEVDDAVTEVDDDDDLPTIMAPDLEPPAPKAAKAPARKAAPKPAAANKPAAAKKAAAKKAAPKKPVKKAGAKKAAPKKAAPKKAAPKKAGAKKAGAKKPVKKAAAKKPASKQAAAKKAAPKKAAKKPARKPAHRR